MTDGQYETPDPDRTKARVAPRVVLASAGVVVATLFATVAALTSGSDDAAPAARNPLEDVVSKSTLRSVPSQVSSTTQTQQEVDALSSVGAPPTTTTAAPKVKVTTVTQPDGTTSTVVDTKPQGTTTPPATTTPSSSTAESTTTVPVTTTSESVPSSSASAAVVSSSANDGVGDR